MIRKRNKRGSQESDVAGKNGDGASRESSLHAGVQDEESKADKMKRFRDLTRRLQEAEDAINAAIAEEDFDKAAELDDTLQILMTEVQSISLTDEEMDAALAGDFPETVESSEEAAAEERTAEKASEREKMEKEPIASTEEDVAKEGQPKGDAKFRPEDSEKARTSADEGTETAEEDEILDNTRDVEDEEAEVEQAKDKNAELSGDSGEIANGDETPDKGEKIASNGDIKAETSAETLEES